MPWQNAMTEVREGVVTYRRRWLRVELVRIIVDGTSSINVQWAATLGWPCRVSPETLTRSAVAEGC
jgi:hypothetical protein